MTAANGLLTAALRYAGLGFKVIPTNGKRPFFPDWTALATNNELVIRQWWRDHPSSNIGIAPDDTFAVLDNDCPKGGDETMAAIERELGALPDTVMSSTGGGGTHSYYRVVAGRPLKYTPGRGVQILGPGRQAVEWPSTHPDTGRSYEWLDGRAPWDIEMADAPAWFYKPPEAERKPNGNGGGSTGSGAKDARAGVYCLAALAGERQSLSAQWPGQRNVELNNSALKLGSLAHHGVFTEDEARAALHAACVDNGLIADDGEDAFGKTFSSGWKAGLAAPRAIPDDEHINGAAGASAPPDLGTWDAGDDTELPPPRGWLLGNVFCRRFLSCLLADGGAGKTALRLAQYLSLASGRCLTGEFVHQRSRVLLVSLEDDGDELRRRLAAAMAHHKVSRADVKGWLFICCPGGKAGKLMTSMAGKQFAGNLGPALEGEIVRRKIDLVAIDPFVKAHGVEENNNSAIDDVVQVLTDLAVKHDCAVDLLHHTRKGPAEAGNADRGRGASALKDGARLAYTLTPMSGDEAERFEISEDERLFYIRMDRGKVNLTPARKTKWFHLTGIKIGNSTSLYPEGDEVQTVEAWAPPDAWRDLNKHMLNRILDEIDTGLPNGERYSPHNRAGERAAWQVVLRHAPGKSEEQAKEIIATWIRNHVLIVEDYESPLRRAAVKGLRVNSAKRPT